MDHKAIATAALEKSRGERERVLAQREQIHNRRNEMEQQDQELIKQLIRLDGEVLAYSKLLDQFGG